MTNEINLIGLSRSNLGRLFCEPFNSSLILTYEIDLIFWEQTILSKFVELGSTNNLILVDNLKFLEASQRESANISKTNRYLWKQIEIGTLFHPKAFLLTGDQRSRLFIGSGNLTYNGLSRNRELYYEFFSDNPSHQNVFSNFCSYILKLIELSHANDDLFNFRLQKLIQQISTENISPTNTVQSECTFLHNLTLPILEQLPNNLTDIIKIHAFSPFLDHDLKTIDWLKMNVHDDIDLYIQKDYTNFKTLQPPQINIYEYPSPTGRNIHAKCILFERSDSLDLLFGSPNLTSAALLKTYPQGNIETAVYMRNLDKNLLKNYLPEKQIPLNIRNIIPMVFSDNYMSNINFIVHSARFTQTQELIIYLTKKINLGDIISLRVNNDWEEAIDCNQDYDRNNNFIKKRILNNITPYTISLVINNLSSNNVLVINEYNALTQHNKAESRIINQLYPILSNDSFNDLVNAYQLSGLITIEKETRIKTIKDLDFDSQQIDSPEKEVESEREIEEYEFYVHEQQLSSPSSVVSEHSNPTNTHFYSFFADTITLLDQMNKKNVSIHKKNENIEQAPHKLNKQMKNIADYITENLRKKIEDRLFEISETEPKNDREFLSIFQLYSIVISLFYLLQKGLLFHSTSQGIDMHIALKKDTLKKLIFNLSKTMMQFWKHANPYFSLLKETVSIKRLIDFFLFNYYLTLIIKSSLNDEYEHCHIFGEKEATQYRLDSILRSMAQFIIFLNIAPTALSDLMCVSSFYSIVRSEDQNKAAYKDNLEKYLSGIVSTESSSSSFN